MKKIFENWRKLLEKTEESGKENYSSFDDYLSSVEKEIGVKTNTLSTVPDKLKRPVDKKDQKKAVTGTINTACNCVDRSLSSLSVKQIKKIINGYYNGKMFKDDEIDNICDEKTQNAIMRFQADTEIRQDGCVGDETEGAMVKVGILKALTGGRKYSSSVSAAPSSADLDVKSSPASSFATGATISIKADTSRGAKKPHWSVPANFHGFGIDTATDKNYKNDAFLVNGKDFNALLKGKPGIATRGTATDQFGHPLLATIIAAAAAFAVEFDKKWAEQTNTSPKTGGNAVLGQVSLGGSSPCQNKNIGITDEDAPCIQGGWTKTLGSHRYGHQSGLEADVGFYTNDNSSGWFNARTNQFKRFDFVRNCAFTEALLSKSGDPNDMIELVLVGPSVVDSMRNWIKKNDLQDTFPNIMQKGGKLRKSAKAKEGKNGHDNHYHIRAKFPNDAPNVSDFKRMIKIKLNQSSTVSDFVASATSVSQVKVALKKLRESYVKLPKGKFVTQTMVKMRDLLIKMGLTDLQKIYGNEFGYFISEIDSVNSPRASYNSDKRFYGASSPKTVAALMQLIKFKNTPSKVLDNDELFDLFVYKARAQEKGKGVYAKSEKNRGSNAMNRAISSTFGGHRSGTGKDARGRTMYKRNRNRKLGIVNPGDWRKLGLGKAFGITNSEFLWGRSNNKQTPSDMAKIFAGLERMYAAITKGSYSSLNAAERSFARSNSKEIKRIVETQKERTHSPRMAYSGIRDLGIRGQGWGKGGRAMHAVSHTFIFNKNGKKYVVSAYVDLRSLHRTGNKKAKIGDEEGYALLNVLIRKLIGIL